MTVLRRLAVLVALAALLITASVAHAASVTVTVTVTGSGSVTSNVGSIDCTAVSGTCSASVDAGTSVTFTAHPAAGVGEPSATFTGWAGTAGCTGTTLTCSVTINASSTVTAGFSTVHARLTVTLLGHGKGSVSSAPGGIDCGTTCSASFTDPTKVTLTATPGTNSKTAEWDGACKGQPADSPCVITVTGGEVTASVTFNPTISNLNVLVMGTGSGKVTSADSSIDCGSTCSASYSDGASVTLTPTASPGSKFSHWSGPCSSGSTDETCTVVVTNGPVTVSAVFELKTSAGDGGVPDAQVDAELISIKHVHDPHGKRVVRVELGVDETVSLDVTVSSGDTTIASRHLATLREGDRFVRLLIPKSTAAGPVTLTIEIHDHAGNDLTIQRTITLPKR